METNGVDSKTAYERWIKEEGVPVAEGYGFDVKEIPLGPWPRRGGRGAFVQLRGMEGATEPLDPEPNWSRAGYSQRQ